MNSDFMWLVFVGGLVTGSFFTYAAKCMWAYRKGYNLGVIRYVNSIPYVQRTRAKILTDSAPVLQQDKRVRDVAGTNL